MKKFKYFQPTEIVFGSGRVKEVGQIAKKIGENCLLVTGKDSNVLAPLYKRVKQYLKDAGIKVTHYGEVIPNPTTNVVTKGADTAKRVKADMIIGLGGGSSMDTAKAIAVEVSNSGSAWDYLYYKKEPSKKTLPIIAITTTSGTGSQVTPCAVITKPEENNKSAIWHSNIYPKVAIVDPELMLTLPASITAMTGFDSFAHNFEAYISTDSNIYSEMLAIKGMKLVAKNLPIVVKDGMNIEARESMAWADTLGGLSISSSGVTLPHGLGMQISGHCPNVAHGKSLAVTYPEFTRYTYKSSIDKFAKVGRVFNKELEQVSNDIAAKQSCEEIDNFLKEIGMWIGFKDLNVTKEDIRKFAENGQVLPDYKNNPRIASIDEMYDMLIKCFER